MHGKPIGQPTLPRQRIPGRIGSCDGLESVLSIPLQDRDQNLVERCLLDSQAVPGMLSSHRQASLCPIRGWAWTWTSPLRIGRLSRPVVSREIYGYFNLQRRDWYVADSRHRVPTLEVCSRCLKRPSAMSLPSGAAWSVFARSAVLSRLSAAERFPQFPSRPPRRSTFPVKECTMVWL